MQENTNMEKCTKYEELFVASDENALLEHIKICPDCAREHEKMRKVSGLIKEVSFSYRAQQKRVTASIVSIAASFFMVFLAFFAVQIATPNSFVNETIATVSNGAYGVDYSYEQMGLPVDEYGFIAVDFGQ